MHTPTHIRSTLAGLLQEKDIKHFSVGELLWPGAAHFSGIVKNTLPPLEALGHLAGIAELADEVRGAFKSPLIILSAFRSVAYNRRVGGARNSYHLTGRALDLAPIQPEQVPDLHLVADKLFASGIIQGGLGIYSWGIHIDSGPRRLF